MEESSSMDSEEAMDLKDRLIEEMAASAQKGQETEDSVQTEADVPQTEEEAP